MASGDRHNSRLRSVGMGKSRRQSSTALRQASPKQYLSTGLPARSPCPLRCLVNGLGRTCGGRSGRQLRPPLGWSSLRGLFRLAVGVDAARIGEVSSGTRAWLGRDRGHCE